MTEPYEYLGEDLGRGDITSEALISENIQTTANMIANENCVLAGSEEATRIFEHEGLRLKHFAKDGEKVAAGTVVMEISGSARALLRAERLALNFVMKMSGIARAKMTTVRLV